MENDNQLIASLEARRDQIQDKICEMRGMISVFEGEKLNLEALINALMEQEKKVKETIDAANAEKNAALIQKQRAEAKLAEVEAKNHILETGMIPEIQPGDRPEIKAAKMKARRANKDKID